MMYTLVTQLEIDVSNWCNKTITTKLPRKEGQVDALWYVNKYLLQYPNTAIEPWESTEDVCDRLEYLGWSLFIFHIKIFESDEN